MSEVGDDLFSILSAVNLPQPGSTLSITSGKTPVVDPEMTCQQTYKIDKHPDTRENAPALHWLVERTFTTRATVRCADNPVENPLLEPIKVNGRSTRDKQEAVFDRFNERILNSSHETVRGPQVEFDNGRNSFRIEQNVELLQWTLCSAMAERCAVNAASIWGFPPRTVKFASWDWDLLYYGQCFKYFKRVLDFEINMRGWDRDLLDEGTKVLKGHWGTTAGTNTGTIGEQTWVLENIGGVAPDPTNPTHFIRFKDRNDENARCVLDGHGLPATRELFSKNITAITVSVLFGGPNTMLVTFDGVLELQVGDRIRIENVIPPHFNGTYEVVTVPSATSATFNLWINPGSWVSGGKGTNLDAANVPGSIHVEYHPGVNFLALGLPTDLGVA